MQTQYQRTGFLVNKITCLPLYKLSCNFDPMKYGERMNQARRYAGLTQPQLAEKLLGALSQQGISYLENSDATGCDFTVQIADICGVSARWLASEIGPMIEQDAIIHDAKIAEAIRVMEQMPEYIIDEQIRQLHLLKKLHNGQHAETAAQPEPALPEIEKPAPKRPASAVTYGPPTAHKKSRTHKKTG